MSQKEQDKSLREEEDAIVGEHNIIHANAPEDSSPRLKLAVKLSEMNNANNQHLVGVLLTQAEAFVADDRQLKAYKQLLQRELYNGARDRVSLIHSIVGRAEVTSFREYPTLDEQTRQPNHDSFVFDNE
jgi:hypothetical protein